MSTVDISKIETRLFINGTFRESKTGKKFDTVNPATEEVIASVSEASTEDIDDAVDAATKAFAKGSPWRTMSAYDRGCVLNKIADLLESNLDYLADLETMDNGKPRAAKRDKYGSSMDLDLAVRIFRYYAGWTDKITGDTVDLGNGMFSCSVKEPIGVCGMIIPWNFPLLMMAWKIAPCLATGCTLVLKTSEKTPLTGLAAAKLMHEAGVPPGVVNIVSGYGDIGQYIAEHNGIRKVAFTGSTGVGHKIIGCSAKTNLKRVSLELGGKSPLIVMKDADVDKAVDIATMGLFLNQGQVCTAGSRLFVHEDIYDEFVKKAVANAEGIKVNDGKHSDTDQGPQVDKIQYDRVMSYIEAGKKEGATLLTGGDRVFDKGYFIQPTVFGDVTDDMKIAREEIFGPVQSILKYKTVDEVVRRANDTIFGLAAGVIGKDIGAVMGLAKQLEAGTVWVNTYNVFESALPFGGYKESGHGREKGKEALENFLETKTITFPIST